MNTNTTNQFEEKDAHRIADLLRKSKGDSFKALQLARTMANAITKEDKAMRRCRAAEDVNEGDIAQVFFLRARLLRDPIIVPNPASQLSVALKPLPMPDPEMEIKIKSVSFREKDRPSDKPCVFFWNADTKNVGEMFMQRYTPKQIFGKHLDTVLKPVGMQTEDGPLGHRMAVKASWSKHAGCKACPCSPGFVLSNREYEYDIHVDYNVVPKSVRKIS